MQTANKIGKGKINSYTFFVMLNKRSKICDAQSQKLVGGATENSNFCCGTLAWNTKQQENTKDCSDRTCFGSLFYHCIC